MNTLTGTEIKIILQEAKTIAIVGASDKPDRDSFKVMRFLIQCGYNVIPVNPAYKEIIGKKCYPNLSEIPEHIDIVDIFRRSEDVKQIVLDAVAIKAKTIWMQLGVVNEEAGQMAVDAGINVVMDRCIKIEYTSLIAHRS